VRPAPGLRLAAAGAGGFLAGAVAMLALQSPAIPVRGPDDSHARATGSTPSISPEAPETFLAWTFGGLPEGFGDRVDALPGIRRVVVVRSGVGWLIRSISAQGQVVDRAPAGLGYPLEVAAARPAEYAPFLPPGDRGVIVPLAEGEGVLGATSAELRGLGPGAVLEFSNGVGIRIAAILPDELVGAHEVFVSYRTAASLGIRNDRYALLQPAEWVQPSLDRRLRSVIPSDSLLNVRAPGETPYFRQGDAVIPQVKVKEYFGEFAGWPDGGYIDADPAWVRENIVTDWVPLLGEVRCHRVLMPQLRGALREVARAGLGRFVKPEQYGGCYASRFLNRIPDAGLSHHSWGMAIDINVADNPLGRPPAQNPRVVEIFERWGFNWGGYWLRPDGMHFEFARFPER
jgi:D-alanyl-D-alanine carboxypeptidase